ncbi:MAG: hypothetical protein IPL49_08575 [Saprospirales bacterium]|nr:hypothetical protein [Saprospirales bacterium]MBK8490925.1 hypothetical protein [Saprospirales bacterium]
MDADSNEYSAAEMAQLYQKHPNEWLLLEVLATNKSGRAERLRLVKYAKNKNDLYDYLMDEVQDWDWSKNFIFVYSDPDKECDLF